MRLALLTDLHANREAVSACLLHAEQQQADRYAFLGDLVGYGADPAWVVDTVMHYVARGAIAVQGNHDHAAVCATRLQMHAEAREAIEWTRTRLSAAQLAFLEQLPLTAEQDGLLFVHASAQQPSAWEYVSGSAEAARSMEAEHCRIIFCGHVHDPALYRRTADGRIGCHTPRGGSHVPLQLQHQYLAIPGSVGQPRDGIPSACYALFDDVSFELSYFRVPYDNGAAARKVIEVGLPIVFAMRLIEGL